MTSDDIACVQDPGGPLMQLAWERQARLLLQAIAVGATAGGTFDEVLQGALTQICTHMAWPLGHVYVPAQGGSGDLVSSHLWHAEDRAQFDRFCRITETTHLPPGVGLPGRILASKQPAWIADILADDNFPRGRLPDLGVRAAFGLPVLAGDEVCAVLEFFSREDRPPDEPLLQVMANIGRQLGHAIERGRAEAALRESEIRFRSVAQSASDAIISADGGGNIISWNRSAERMFGYGAAEVIGMSLTLIIPARYRQAHERAMAHVTRGGPSRVIGKTVELEGLRRDGGEFPLELSLATWLCGDARFFSGILRDISERRAAELKLRTIAAQLARSEREAQAAKEEALRQEQLAREASRAKSSFLANMSHELRTPLNVILGFVQLMQRDLGLGTEQRESLGTILHSGEHLLGLINGVLSISKIEAGQVPLAESAFDLHRLLRGLDASFRTRAEGKGLKLTIELGEGLPQKVQGDESKLRQVLINLVGNAVKFTASGGVSLRALWADGAATFAVEDSGPGMEQADLDKLFQPFVQTVSGQRSKEGTGLGLALSRSFARLMGGDIQVQSQPGRGSIFTVEVRLIAAEAGVLPPEYLPVVGLLPGQPACRILVADDDVDSRKLLVRLLSAVGLEVREAKDGDEAIAVWTNWQPHLIWMDMRMPVIDGYQATREIRRREQAATGQCHRTVIVALTASAFEHDRDALLAVGCDSFMPKPYAEARIFGELEHRLGLRFVHASPRVSSEHAATADPRGGGDARAAHHPVPFPPALLGALRQALTIGDDIGAHRAIDQMSPQDPQLADEFRALLKDFQLDELLARVEAIRE